MLDILPTRAQGLWGGEKYRPAGIGVKPTVQTSKLKQTWVIYAAPRVGVGEGLPMPREPALMASEGMDAESAASRERA
jgi:hypothetical protein